MNIHAACYREAGQAFVAGDRQNAEERRQFDVEATQVGWRSGDHQLRAGASHRERGQVGACERGQGARHGVHGEGPQTGHGLRVPRVGGEQGRRRTRL